MRWLWCVALVASGGIAAPTDVSVDFGKLDARKFDGIGALSGGGGVTRLLIDYPENQYEDVFDSLFGPNGANPHIIKVEIGGDTQSTEGTEPAHMHTKDDLNCWRGYEWTVLKEAKKRNPDILTYGLSWGVPAWAGDNEGNFFTDANTEFHLQWLKCAQEVHDVKIDFLGIWNERAWQADWIIGLRAALDDAGYSDTRIVAADDGGGNAWKVGVAMAGNASLRKAIDGAIGVHYPYPSKDWAPAEVQELGVPMWASEEWDLSRVNDYGGAMVLAETLNGNYISGSLTATIVWNLVFSWYAILPYSKPTSSVSGLGHSLVSAAEPWSGHWEWTAPAAAMAHTTQFSKPGWRYVKPAADHGTGAGSGYDGDVSFVTLVSPASTDGSVDFSVVITNSGKQDTELHFACSNLPGSNPPAAMAVFATNSSTFLARMPDAPFRGGFTVSVPANGIVTATTTRWGQGPYQPKHPVPEPSRFPRTYKDSFDDYAPTRTYAKYFSDLGGVFTVNPNPAPGQVAGDGYLTQVIVSRPLAWESNPDPYTIIGDFNPPNGTDTGWTGYTVAIRAAVTSVPLKTSDTPYLKLCVNIAEYKRNGAPVQGQCLIVTAEFSSGSEASWQIQDAGSTVGKGSVGAQVRLNEWQDLSLTVFEGLATASLNNTVLTKGVPVNGSTYGQAALGCGWHQAKFDDFFVAPVAE